MTVPKRNLVLQGHGRQERPTDLLVGEIEPQTSDKFYMFESVG